MDTAAEAMDTATAFEHVVRTRRSVRKFTGEVIPEDVVRKCIELGTLAANSSNLQTWRFHWVRDAALKQKMVPACLNQNAAKTASDLIVVTVRPSIWRSHTRWNLEHHPLQPVPKIVEMYYSKLAPIMYTVGPLGLLAPLKWLLVSLVALRTPMIREPLTPAGLRLWAVKSAALACQNIMLAFRAEGYDTCPMEGYDRVRLRKVLPIPRSEYIVMVIAAGVAAEDGVYHEQYRVPITDVIQNY